uniref:Uncharacterized LOC115376118 n=1 Tax=Myripristis murdjan TaxID=586833 RepID=A0A667YZY4_9TELE
MSEPAGLNITYPDLVKNVQCVIHATSLTNCSWQPATPVPDLQFYYWLMKQGGKACEPDYHLEMCSTYVYKDGVKTGCHVPSDDNTVDMYLLFNGTINGTVVKNVFTISMINNVKPPALNWTAIKKGGEFKITWDPVDIKSIRHWCYNLSYTECGEKKNKTGGDSITLKVVPKCRYTMTMKAVKGKCEDKGTAESEESDEKIFEAEMNPALFAIILIPVMFSILAVVALVCFRKHKPKLFPKIPKVPPNFMDILDNNNERSTNPSVLSKKEEECDIALVIEDQPASPES